MDAREHARTLLDIVKRQTGRSHYSEVADVLRPIYAAAGLDPHSEGWPTAESLKMLARRGKIRRKRFLARSLKRLGRISGTR